MQKPKVEARTKVEVQTKTNSAAERRARRIEMLESRIEELMKEVKKLKAEGDSGNEDEEV